MTEPMWFPKGCSHGKTFSQRCVECDLLLAREGERWALADVAKYRARIALLESELASHNAEKANDK